MDMSAFAGAVRAVLPVLVFAGGAVSVLVGVLLLTGHAPGPALAALVRGAAESSYALSSVVRSIPLALSGLAVTLAFRAGLLNIGAEGQSVDWCVCGNSDWGCTSRHQWRDRNSGVVGRRRSGRCRVGVDRCGIGQTVWCA